eukprot:5520183-Pyramimonas_sp.AAC.2
MSSDDDMDAGTNHKRIVCRTHRPPVLSVKAMLVRESKVKGEQVVSRCWNECQKNKRRGRNEFNIIT